VLIWVFTGELASLLVFEGLAALFGLEVHLHVVECPIGLVLLVGVAGVAVHVAVGVGGTTVRKKMHDLVDGLLQCRKVILEHGGIL
jgi:hypothetical protein